MTVCRLTGIAAALAGLSLLASAPVHAAVNASSARSSVRAVWMGQHNTVTADPWVRDRDGDGDRDRGGRRTRLYYRRRVIVEPTYVYPTYQPAPYSRPGWFWHNNHWYHHRRLNAGLWIYF